MHDSPQGQPGWCVPMTGGRVKLKFLLLAISSYFLIATPCHADGRPTAKRAVKQEQPAPPPAPPATLEQEPAVPPQIAFQGGQLTITAENSTLGDILRGVRAQTGAEVDVPGNATERVVGHFGPGPARDVLAALLYGSRFNYVLLGSPTDPSVLDRVILLAKSSVASEQETASQGDPGQQLAQNPPPARPVVAAAADTDDSDDSDDTDDAADDQTAQDDDQQAQQGTGGAQGEPVVKTPEQMMQELQQRQQQMQQQQQQQGANAGETPPTPPNLPGGIPRPLPGQEPH